MLTKNCSLNKFSNQIKGKKIACFGAGLAGQVMASRLESTVLDQILFFVDNDKNKWGCEIEIQEKRYPIKSLDELQKSDIKNMVILITSRFWDQIHAQLEAISTLKNVECFVYLLMKRNSGVKQFMIPEGPSLIPKKIHYCWFGNNAMSENEMKCMESWKKFCPDYEIIRWDEHNYDCKKTRYLKEVYDYGHYSAVSSYARFEILGEVGGIYLDTDVEIIKNIDELLRLPAYMGFEVTDVVNTGHGFGGMKGNAVYKEIIEYYDSMSHYNEKGEFHYTGCPVITSKISEKHGLIPDGTLQQIEDITIFPNDYFDPVMQIPTDNTYSVHRYSSLWSLKGMDMRTVWRKQREYWEYLRQAELIEDL